jgi:hypothetical protein
MFGKHHTLRQLAGGIAITASIAVVAVPSAFSSTSPRSGLITDTLGGNGSAKALPDAIDRYVATHGAQPTQVQGMRFITDTLGGNGSAKALPDAIDRYVATHGAQPTQVQVQGMRFITDTLGGNGSLKTLPNPGAYVTGGASPAVVTGDSSSTGFNWGDAGVGAGLGAGLLLLLLVATRLRTHKRGPLAV